MRSHRHGFCDRWQLLDSCIAWFWCDSFAFVGVAAVDRLWRRDGTSAVDVSGMLAVTGLEKCFQKMFAFEIVSP